MSLTKFAMWLNYSIRRHPSRLLYTDRFLGKYIDAKEEPFFIKDWGRGIIWDVGASIGKYTTVLAKHNPNATICAFEPNLNSIYYLAYRTAACQNVIIVPNALTLDGGALKGSHDPDFNSPSTGPMVATISIKEALAKFGIPTFIKMDIEGAEYHIFESEEVSSLLRQSTILVSWHPQFSGKPIPEVKGWKNERVAHDITLLSPL